MIALVIWLALLGFIVWLITTWIPMPDAIRKAIIVIVVIVIVLYLLQLFGLDIPLPRRP